MTGWDNFTGNHGVVVKFCAKLFQGIDVLDVGCGLCHLYEALTDDYQIYDYVGVDNDRRVLKWARQRYPNLDLKYGDVYNLSFLGERKFDSVFAIGLYRMPHQIDGIKEMLKHTKTQLILTYLHRGAEPRVFPEVFWEALSDKQVNSLKIFNHGIKGIEIVGLLKC